MLKRIALVFWWAGALAGVAGALFGFSMLLTEHGHPVGLWLAGTAMGAAAAAALWAVAFICGGSFWRPPRLPQV